MEELVKMLIDQGAISAAADGWALDAGKLLATQVPKTLTGVLQARLDGLPAAERLALQQASVIGAMFWDQALVALDPQAKEALPALVRRQLVVPRMGAAIEGLREYAFAHQILHHVTYDTVLKRVRGELHGRAARWFSGLAGVRAKDFLGVAAEHYARAGDAAQAAEFHARAAEHAKERFVHAAVLEHVAEALVLTDPADPASAPLRSRLLRAREQTLDLLARRSDQAADIEELEKLAEVLGSDASRAYAAWRRSLLALRVAEWPACERAARTGIACAERAQDHGLRLHSVRLLASAMAMQGDAEGGKALAQRARIEARALGLRANEGSLINTLIVIANLQGDVIGNLDLCRESLRLDRENGDRRSEAIALSNLGVAWLELGDLEQARAHSEKALGMLRAHGDRLIEGVTLCVLSDAALMGGDPASALAFAQSALDIFTATQARDREVDAFLKRGHAELALGRHAAAQRSFEQMLETAVAVSSPWQHDARAGLAQVASGQGDAATALGHVEALLLDLAGGGTLSGTVSPRRIELTCHRVLSRAGDPRAAEWLSRAFAALQAQADTIADAAMRERFLRDIPHHQAIVTSMAASKDADG